MNQQIQNMVRQLQQDPKGFLAKVGKQIPDQIMGDPQAMVMHLIQTGQVNNPLLQMMFGKMK